jgi:hypothetical protein
MRKMLLRSKGERKWHDVSEAPFRDEAHLQKLLYEDPRLIPFADLGEGYPEPRAFVREAGLPGSGNTDLVGVDEQGRITVIECKLATNPEQKRKVVGQVLEYAAFLWQMSYESFEKLFARSLAAAGKSGLAQLVAPEDNSEWSEAEFPGNVEASLEKGDFTLIIAVDALNDELRRIIQYLNRGQRNGTTVCAVEVGYFLGEEHEIVAPRLVGPKSEPPPPPGKWDELRFFTATAAKCGAEAVATVRALYEFTQKESDNCAWGRGQDGSFTFRLERDGVTGSVFSVFTSGSIMLSFGYMDGRVPESAVNRFADELAQLPGLDDLPAVLQVKRFPRYQVADAFAAPGNLEAFEQAVLKVRDSLGK